MTEDTTNDSLQPLKNVGLLGAGALATAGLVLGAAGLAGAQDDEPTLDDSAPAAESSYRDTHRAAHDARRQAIIDELIEDGTITEDQVDDWNAVREAIAAERDAHRQERLSEVAEVLGISVDELEAARDAGESLADIAGDDLDALVDYMVEQSTERIDQAVADGLLTREQADERVAGLAERIQRRIESGGGFGGGHRHGFRHRHPGAGQGAGGADAEAVVDALAASLT